MEYTRDTKEAVIKELGVLKTAIIKRDAAIKNVNDQLHKLKGIAAVTGGNETDVMNEVLLLLGRWLEQSGLPE